ncbi:hypothetical protein Tco_0404833 [Tanacetum coccineum]
MSSITAQQAKLDLELVPNKKRLEIGKCNRRLNPGKIQREPTFQVGQDFDTLPTDEEIVSFLRELGHTGEINSLNDVVVDQMHQPWRTFAAPINRSLSRKTTGHDKLLSPEEPTKKTKRVKRPAKKSTKVPAGGIVTIETPKMPLSKKKEKITVEKRKGIDLLYEVALTEEAQYKEVRRKSLRDFHMTHLSGSGTVNKTTPSAAKIKPSVTNEGTGGNDEDDSNNEQDSRSEGSDEENDCDDKDTQSDNEKRSDSEHETDENKSNSKSDHQENEEEDEDDEEEEEDEFVKTSSNDSGDEDKAKITDKLKVMNMKRWIILPVSYTMMWIYGWINQFKLTMRRFKRRVPMLN